MLAAQRLAEHGKEQVLAQQLWQKVRDLEQQQKALERTHQTEVQKVQGLEQQQTALEADVHGLEQELTSMHTALHALAPQVEFKALAVRVQRLEAGKQGALDPERNDAICQLEGCEKPSMRSQGQTVAVMKPTSCETTRSYLVTNSVSYFGAKSVG